MSSPVFYTRTFLGPLVVIDVEDGGFLATADGITTQFYKVEQIKAGKHLDDFPGCNMGVEGAHYSPKLEGDRGRGAQVFERHELEMILEDARRRGVTYYRLPQRMTKRVLEMAGFEKDKDACLAWWRYCNTQRKIIDEAPVLRLKTDDDYRRDALVREARRNSNIRIDTLAAPGVNYQHEETDTCFGILTKAHEAGRLTDELVNEFKLKLPGTGRNKSETVSFVGEKPVAVMAMYVSCCEADGSFRRNTRGNRIGVDTVRGKILQHNPHHSGKGSFAACRAKTRWFRLRPAENAFRKRPENEAFKKPEGMKFAPAIPEVRKKHERLNRELIKIFRDFSK